VEQNPDLQLGVDESYNLTISSTGTATLRANRIWGALRGLESFSQLVDFDPKTTTYSVVDTPVTIVDQPRFQWRGLLMDTSRHFLDAATLYRTIDALAYNKMNTLHWHTVDAQSFPVESISYPNLTAAGAYHPTLAVYKQSFIKDVVAYGYQRGVRVVPEFDIPGHAYSWGNSYPIRSQCPSNYAANINNYPLDPSSNQTLPIVQAFLAEMVKLFNDKTLHLGGDEVETVCWTQNPQVATWMQTQGFTTGEQVYQYFETAFAGYVQSFNRTLVVWQDVFNAGVSLADSTIVQIWEDQNTLAQVVGAGLKAITAFPYYLDKQVPVAGVTQYEWIDTWKNFYAIEPTSGVTKNVDLILGGEACMWGEQVDGTVFDERVWPRASAVGERLWSPQNTTDVNDAKLRLIDFRCRLARRGINASPIAPDFCPLSLTPSN